MRVAVECSGERTARDPWRLTALALLAAAMLLPAPDDARGAPRVERVGRLPLAFEVNQGQAPPDVAFLARGVGYRVFLAPAEIRLLLEPADGTARSAGPWRARDWTTRLDRRSSSRPRVAIRMAFEGATVGALEGAAPLEGRVNYLRGTDPARWQHGVATHARVRAAGIYPGVNLVYYGNRDRLEYDLIVAPGTDPTAIRVALTDEAGSPLDIALDAAGDLVIRTGGGDLRLEKPLAYQETDGGRRPVTVRYALLGEPGSARFGFAVGTYDPGRPLVIDPVLDYSHYLGGTGLDEGTAIAAGADGSTYVAGITTSADFPGAAAGGEGGDDAFVAKLSPTGAVVWATYLGGAGADRALALAVDGAGRTYVTGTTDSADFPAVNAYQTHQGGVDAFVAVLDQAGTPVYSTYLGGAGQDEGLGIAADAAGMAYVTGSTTSAGFAGAAGGPAGPSDAFLVKLDPATGGPGSVVYARYLGGSGADSGQGIATGDAGRVFVVGRTDSGDFPTTGTALRATPPSAVRVDDLDGFVAALDAGTGATTYATYLGGTGDDVALSAAAGADGKVAVTGFTSSSGFPTRSGFQKTLATVTPPGGTPVPTMDAFVTVLDTAASGFDSLLYSSFLGGTGTDFGSGVAMDPSGHVLVTGSTDSADFPLENAELATLRGIDAFVAKIDPLADDAASLHYATLLGGSGQDEGQSIAVDGAGSAHVTGFTLSADLHGASGALQAQDGFVARLSQADLTISEFTPALNAAGTHIVGTVKTRNVGPAPAPATTTRIFLSADNRLGAEDTELAPPRDVPALAAAGQPGEEDPGDLAQAVGPLAPGTYFLFAVADADDALDEVRENNNRSRVTLRIGPDLVVSSLSAAIDATTITVTDRTANTGTTAATESATGFYLSSGIVTDVTQCTTPETLASAVLLGQRSVGGLGPGESTDAIASPFTLPGATAGSRCLIARANDGATPVAEVSTTNNVLARLVDIGVDLVVESLSAEVTGTSGGLVTVQVTDKTTNRGAAGAAASTTEFWLSADDVLDPGDTPLGSRGVPALGPGGSSQVATPFAGVTPGQYFLIARANGGATPLGETSTANNLRVISVALGPDLIVNGLTARLKNNGAAVEVYDQIRNLQPTAVAGPSTSGIYVSTSPTLDGSARRIGERAVPGGETRNSGIAVYPVPLDLAGGNYYVIVKADDLGQVSEVDETNNIRVTTEALAVPAPASDLVVETLSAAVTATGAGGLLTVQVTDKTTNLGAAAGASTTEFWLSADNTLDAGDTLLGSRAVPALGIGGFSEAATPFSGVTPGRYFLIARANGGATPIAESNTANNLRVLSVALGPDLIVNGLTARLMNNGTAVEVYDQIRNLTATAAGPSTSGIYVSTSPALDGSARRIGERAVPGGETRNSGIAVYPLPLDLAGGNYYVIVKADDLGQVGELDETNNLRATTETLAVPGAAADLVVETLSATVTATGAGGLLTVQITDRTANRGAAAGASTTEFWLSADNLLDAGDTRVGSRAVPALGVGGFSEVATPFSGVTPGRYFLIAKANAGATPIAESNTANNLRVLSVALGPDLVVNDLTARLKNNGTAVEVYDQIRNIAPATAAGPSTSGIYVSTSPALDGSARRIGERAVAGGEIRNGGIAVYPLPLDLPGGDYYVIVRADDLGQVPELDETNNVRATTATLAIAGASADLVVETLSATVTGTSGGGLLTVQITDRTANRGAAAGASTTEFWLSADNLLDAGDTRVGSRAVPALGVGGFSEVATPFAGVTPGRYFLIAKANAGATPIAESNTGNNLRVVSVAFGADLIVNDLTARLKNNGAAVEVYDQIRNIAPATAAGPSTSGIYVSTSPAFDGSARRIGERAVPGGEIRNGGIAVYPLPLDLAGGNYYVIVRADDLGQVLELDETNNVRATTATLAIAAPSADLVVEALSATVTATAADGLLTVQITDKTTNLGAAAAASVTEFWLSADNLLDAGDTPLGSRAVPALGVGGFSQVATPFAGVTPGRYFLIARANGGATPIAESTTANNLRVISVALGPDLIVNGLTARLRNGGTAIEVYDQIRNIATATAAGPSTSGIYLSTSPALDGSARRIGERAVPGGDNRNGGIAVYPLPLDLPAGNYHVIVKADDLQAVLEIDETNNLMATPDPLPIAVPPDLAVTALNAPAAAVRGALITILDTTSSLQAAVPSPTVTRVYLSSDQVLDGTDISLGERAVAALGIAEVSQGETVVEVPRTLPVGSYYLLVVADADTQVQELGEADATAMGVNNVMRAAITIQP